MGVTMIMTTASTAILMLELVILAVLMIRTVLVKLFVTEITCAMILDYQSSLKLLSKPKIVLDVKMPMRKMGYRLIWLEERGLSVVPTLDNKDSHDYVANNVAIFESSKDDASPDDGLGGCDNFDLNIGLDAAKATWTGAGSWTPESD